MKKTQVIDTRKTFLSMALAFALSGTLCKGADTGLTVKGEFSRDSSRPIPISISGFGGEALRVLSFDLEVAGCKITPESQADYLVSGRFTTRLEGYLAKADKKFLLSRAYNSSNQRAAAHAFADELIPLITGSPGITRTRIAFKSATRGRSEIYFADYDGHNAVPATRDGVITTAPSWGLGNSHLFYTSYKLNNPDIVSQNIGTRQRKILARYSGSNLTPVPSPDGTKLAMVLSKSGSPNLYVAGIDGSKPRQITFSSRGVATPTWSPDSQWICYTSRESGPARLYKISANGGQATRISVVGTYNATEPDWSPDGKWIAFTTQSGGGFTICIVPAGGGSAERFTEGEDPSWAPNSRTLMFVKRRRDQSYYLSLLDAVTKQVKDVPLNLGNTSQPAWAR